jgi:gliding motility-associated-like protein
VLTSNEPICVGQTLLLTALDSVQGGFYMWYLPGGDSVVTQNLTIPNAAYTDTGIYKVEYNYQNCISRSSEDIALYPPIVLTNITPNTAIAYGSSIQLNVDGAKYYWWSPDNGSLNNPNLNNPMASPTVATVYTVVGTSQYGCMDTAEIAITIINPMAVIIPSAFTPNGDGLNDIFRLANLSYQKLVEFSVFNRWGQLVYHSTNGDAKAGWDGTFNGAPADMGVYNYFIIVSNPDGTNQIYKGDVTLIR